MILIYTISAIGFLAQMYYVTEELMAPSFSDIEIKQEKLGEKECNILNKPESQFLIPIIPKIRKGNI